jgi:hypothetical protein
MAGCFSFRKRWRAVNKAGQKTHTRDKGTGGGEALKVKEWSLNCRASPIRLIGPRGFT